MDSALGAAGRSVNETLPWRGRCFSVAVCRCAQFSSDAIEIESTRRGCKQEEVRQGGGRLLMIGGKFRWQGI